ncbi:MAG: hypothetical protein LBL57_11560, partial [Tannerella sp.]|nr:hypothetical protein [Tannerella sp.]
MTQVTDVKTASVNDLLTPSRNLKISRHKIKIAGNNTANFPFYPVSVNRYHIADTARVWRNLSGFASCFFNFFFPLCIQYTGKYAI